jgi:DNA-binding NarL/FixJ family response regulator
LIVLVDDNPAHRLLIKRAVRRALPEMEFKECSSYLQGVGYLVTAQGTPPELFLIDLNLGDGRGTDLVREIKKRWPTEETNVLLLSTSDLAEDRKDAQEAQVTQYVLKHDDPILFSEQMTKLIQEIYGLGQQ